MQGEKEGTREGEQEKGRKEDKKKRRDPDVFRHYDGSLCTQKQPEVT